MNLASIEAKVEIVQFADQTFCLLDTPLVGSAHRNEVVDVDRDAKAENQRQRITSGMILAVSLGARASPNRILAH